MAGNACGCLGLEGSRTVQAGRRPTCDCLGLQTVLVHRAHQPATVLEQIKCLFPPLKPAPEGLEQTGTPHPALLPPPANSGGGVQKGGGAPVPEAPPPQEPNRRALPAPFPAPP